MNIVKGKDSMIKMIKSPYIKGFIKKYKIRYFIGIVFLVLIDYLQTMLPLIIGSVIDGYKSGVYKSNNISHELLNIGVIAVFIVLGRIMWRYFIFGTSRMVERDIRNDLFDHLQLLSQRYYNNHKTGEIMAYITNDLEAVRNAMGQGFMMLFDVIALFIFTMYNMLTQINIVLTLSAVFPLVLIALLTTVIGPKLFRRYADRQEAFAEISDFVQENLSGIKVIKAFVQQKQEIMQFEKISKNYFDKNMKLFKLQALMRPSMNLISGIALAIAVGVGGIITYKGNISVGDFTAFIEYLGMLVWPMMAVGITINMITMGSAALERIEGVLKEPVEISDDGANEDIKIIDGSIKITNLSYKYPGTDTYVLKDINIELKKGETLGIVGRTGSGKTTIVNLLLRMYNVDRGSIKIGGYDILDIPLNVLRTNIGYVPQDNFLFSDTIKNNIDFSDGTLSDEAIVDAANFSCVHDNIVEFKDSYRTLVGERGVTLSGGQKQRVSISRAIIKEPEILILDDSVSAVDTDTEEKILNNLKKTRQGKTNIIIAHRISTIQHADQIIVVDDGKIVEHGNHKQLVAMNGIYNSLYQKQLLEQMIDEEV